MNRQGKVIFVKKVTKAMKMLIKQYYGYRFAILIGTNTLQIVFDFITYLIVNSFI